MPTATAPEERAALALVLRVRTIVQARDTARQEADRLASRLAAIEMERSDARRDASHLNGRLLGAEETIRDLRAQLHAARAQESGLCLERDGARAALADSRRDATRTADSLIRAENERDGLRECLLAAVAFVELHTGDGCREQPPAWARVPDADNFSAERIAQVSRAVLATIAAPDIPEAARATVLHIAEKARKQAERKRRETYTRI